MKIGTKSVLFGVHQFLWHPITVGIAWRRLFKVWPTRKEWICIFVHDLGYWGKPNIDGPEGRTHPEFGAILAHQFADQSSTTGSHTYHDFTLFHSREYAKLNGQEPSLLCWADKYCVLCEPRWFYLLRAKLSGESKEFKANAPEHVRVESDWFWLIWYRTKVLNFKEIRKLLDQR
jgi:hypothetical protein